jgi:hypothetical protein
METRVLATFGHVATLCTTAPGETRTVQLDENGKAASGHYFYVQGRVVHSVQGTGEQLTDRVEGWLSCEHNNPASTPNGIVDNSFPEGAQWLCIANKFNPTGLPNVSSLILEDQASEQLVNGANVYLVRGALLIGDKTFTGPTQIRVRSGNVTATSQGKSYSLRFP